MIIGTVKEIINNEFRVGITISSAKEYIANGHQVIVEKDAGIESGISNLAYQNAGVLVLDTAKEVWDQAQMIIKVKEPTASEYQYFKKNQIIFSFMHLSAHPDLLKELVKNQTNAVAYETIETDDGQLVCLQPMSEIAGRLSAIEGAKYLQKTFGGSGVLISGIPGVENAQAVVIGAGNVGMNAIKMLTGLGARVTVLDLDMNKLSEIDRQYGSLVQTLYSSEENLEQAVMTADLIIAAVLIPGAKAPKLIKREYYKKMRPGSVIIDVGIDQGGASEVSRATTHDNPTYVVDGILHYAVPNMPGSVPITATKALCNVTLEYALLIANLGLKEAMKASNALRKGVNVFEGEIVNEIVKKTYK